MGFLYGLIAAVLIIGFWLLVIRGAGRAWRGVPTSGHIAAAQTREDYRRAGVQAENDWADGVVATAVRTLDSIPWGIWSAAGGTTQEYAEYRRQPSDISRRNWLRRHPVLAAHLFPRGIPDQAQP